MPNYKRSYQKGGHFFFTLVTNNRVPYFNLPEVRKALRLSIQETRDQLEFKITAIVLLPEHLHIVLALPENDLDYSKRIGLIKAKTSKKLAAYYSQNNIQSIWQKRFWEHQIRSEKDLNKHIDYIHINPLKHDLVTNLNLWPYSSFHRFKKQGHYAENWGVNTKIEGEFGE